MFSHTRVLSLRSPGRVTRKASGRGRSYSSSASLSACSIASAAPTCSCVGIRTSLGGGNLGGLVSSPSSPSAHLREAAAQPGGPCLDELSGESRHYAVPG